MHIVTKPENAFSILDLRESERGSYSLPTASPIFVDRVCGNLQAEPDFSVSTNSFTFCNFKCQAL